MDGVLWTTVKYEALMYDKIFIVMQAKLYGFRWRDKYY